METTGSYAIRPAGKHILTIGRELIQDKHAAIVELVKNAYDADATNVKIEFTGGHNQQSFSIVITDDGHGMTRETVLSKWLVPSTNDKLDRKISPKGRTMQGRKGIGRYAAALLGDDLALRTVTLSGIETEAYIEWARFERAKHLDEVTVVVKSYTSDATPGTQLVIEGGRDQYQYWDSGHIDRLRFELKKLMSPIANSSDANHIFEIDLVFDHFLPGKQKVERERIEPYPLLELYDYRIAGTIEPAGSGLLEYSTQKAHNTTSEIISFDKGTPTNCGYLEFDIRVYDRETEAVELLIGRGLRDETGKYLGVNQAKSLLNALNGVGVYRNGFRIRPLGDAAFDWLTLNERRVQNPSMRIGSNQVIGHVKIQSEELSGLIEKSARDGLRQNEAYESLIDISRDVISALESRRFSFRRKIGLAKPAIKVEKELQRLFDFDTLKQIIRTTVIGKGLTEQDADQIIDSISKEETSKNELAEDLRTAVAIYQGQATLGKIINVILHEGRRPLNYFRNQIPSLHYWYDAYQASPDPASITKVIPIVDGIENNAQIFVNLFSRLDPLAAGKRGSKTHQPIAKLIRGAFDVFSMDIKNSNIEVKFTGANDCIYGCWQQDIYAIFVNLIDNSVFWMIEKSSKIKEISIDVVATDGKLEYVDYRDTGPGIAASMIESAVIFEPQFSTKSQGTGLGLAIAGEAATRSDLELRALVSDTGAYFRLQTLPEA